MLYRQPERISELAVLPESRGLLVTAVDPVSNLQQIFHVATSDGTKTRVTNDLFFYYGVSVDREGKYVVASQRSEQQKIWVGDADNLSGLKPVNQEPNANRRVNWTPDGRLVYDGYENNLSHIWISDAEGRDLQKLSTTESDDYDPRVSADGRYIVFISRRTGRPQVWRMNIDGSDQVLLADLNGITVSPTFAADGQTVVFEWLAEGDRKLMSIPVTGGPATQVRRLDDIPQNYLFYWAASPDGRYIAQSVWDKSESRMKVSVIPQRPQALPKLFDIWPSLIFKWTLDSKRIIYREKQVGFEPESNVLEANVESGKVATMLSTSPEYVVDISFSRDGQKVAVVRGKNTSNAVMLSPSAGR
jgi:Tol biopolymer transport system component